MTGHWWALAAAAAIIGIGLFVLKFGDLADHTCHKADQRKARAAGRRDMPSWDTSGVHCHCPWDGNRDQFTHQDGCPAVVHCEPADVIAQVITDVHPYAGWDHCDRCYATFERTNNQHDQREQS